MFAAFRMRATLSVKRETRLASKCVYNQSAKFSGTSKKNSIGFPRESNVMSYGRSFDTVFERASGCFLWDKQGKRYLDFLAAAGSLNYGHNHPQLKQAEIEYINRDGILQALDKQTAAKEHFLDTFENLILKPRGLDNYVVQFVGPTGTNAVEAALKLARKVTGNQDIVSFTNAYHGMTLGSLSISGNKSNRAAAGIALNGAIRLPYCGYTEEGSSMDLLQKYLSDPSSGIETPAGVIVECVQGEGGLNVASDTWLQQVESLCKSFNIPLIVDDIQAGCGRTGSFFSFESAGIKPDMITLSKSISAMGHPMSVVLIREDLDIWKPGEHNGTFRGNNRAFVTAARGLELFWSDDRLEKEVARKSEVVRQAFQELVDIDQERVITVKGKGLMIGFECDSAKTSASIRSKCFQKGLIIEACGPSSEIVKCFPPLVIEDNLLYEGLDIIKQSVLQVLEEPSND